MKTRSADKALIGNSREKDAGCCGSGKRSATPDIAQELYSSPSHVRNVGSDLWKTLSKGLKKNITKNNFRAVLEKGIVYNYQSAIVENITGESITVNNKLNISGIGKTALTLQLIPQIQHEFDCIIWRSLHNAPPLESLQTDLIQSCRGGVKSARRMGDRGEIAPTRIFAFLIPLL